MVVFLLASALKAQSWEVNNRDTARVQLFKGLEYNVELQGRLSKGKTPLWLNANM